MKATAAGALAQRDPQAVVLRWMRPLAVLVLLVVVWGAVQGSPGPADSVAVAVALGAFGAGGLGVLVTSDEAVGVHLGFVILLVGASVALMWLQPDGVGIAGVFVALARLAVLLRNHRWVPLIVVALVLGIVVVGAASDGSITSALLSAITLAAFYGTLFLAMRLGDAKRLSERLLTVVEQGRAGAARAAGLAERQRLAREMHDVLAHSLSGLILQLEAARMLAAADPADPRLPAAVDRAHQLGLAGLDEARRAIGLLRDDELPGPDRLAGLAEQFARDRDVPCSLTVSGPPHPLAPEVRLAVYRVAQEALTNITRHAEPERVELSLAYEISGTRLTIEDFGPAGPAEPGDGYGLTGMRERAELLGGTLTTRVTGQGFRVELRVPA